MSTLRGITWDHPRGYAPLAASERMYEDPDGIQIRWDKRSLKEFGDAPLVELASEYDLIVLDHPHMGVAAKENCLLPLEEWIPASLLQELAISSAGPSFDSYHFQDHQWALPVDAACQMAAYRSDLLPEHALPHTWPEVFRLAEELREQGRTIGMALCPTDSLCSFLTLCAQRGYGPVEGHTELVPEEIGRQVLQDLRTLKQSCHPDSLSWNPIALFDHMSAAQHQIAYAPLAFGYTNYSRPGFAEKRLAFTSIPGKTHALIGGAGLAISRTCPHPEAAARYIAWVCSEPFQCSGYTRNGGQPGNGAAWTDPVADRITGGFLSNTYDTLHYAYMRPRSASWPAFQENLGEQIHAFLSDDSLPPKQTFHYIQSLYSQETS